MNSFKHLCEILHTDKPRLRLFGQHSEDGILDRRRKGGNPIT